MTFVNKGLLATLLAFVLTGCHNYSANVGEVLGCTLAGNGCNSRGADGANGTNGSSCTVQTVLASEAAPAGGALLSCTDGTNALIRNGTDGADGADGVTPIIQVIKPCPNISGSNPEVLLVLPGRQLLASVSKTVGGVETRLAIVTPGSYMTTDGRSCNFTVTSTTVSWTGGSASY
jgi:hypothetical protein